MKRILVSGSRGKSSIRDFILNSGIEKQIEVKELDKNDKSCDILIISNIYDKEEFDKIYKYIFHNEINNVIINGDDELTNKIFVNNLNFNVITCGFNSKSSVTASSVIYNEGSYRFNYCIQRSFKDYKGNLIEPMEIPIEINMYGQYNIYNSLFVITVLILMGKSIDDIHNYLSLYKNKKNFFAISNNKFKILYHYARKEIDYLNAFDVISDISYNRLFLIYNSKDFNYNEDIIETLIENNKHILNIEKIIPAGNKFNFKKEEINRVSDNDLILIIGSFEEEFNKQMLNYIYNLS